MNRVRIALMTRLPLAGETKTRLIPALGAAGAASLQREMTEHVAGQLRILRATDGWRSDVRVAGGSARDAARWLRLPAAVQGDGNLGVRQARALAECLGDATVAMVVGGDCPTVDAEDMREAAAAAERVGAALIAATDGGYCLLAVRADLRERIGTILDSGIEWGGPDVLEQTRRRLEFAGARVEVLGPRADVDEPGDLPVWDAVRAAWYESPRSLSVVIPTLDDAAMLRRLLDHLAAEPVDVVVCDGGSTDDTVKVAEAAGARVILAPRGRGRQLDAGGRAATGAALLFLHADTLPPAGAAGLVLAALADGDLTLGAFRFAIPTPSPSLRVIQAGTRLRSSLLRFPYGDQGLFCRAAMWRALGGFGGAPVMEDYELVRRARRVGRVRVLPNDALTSDRAWRHNGVWRWTALNVGTVLRYRAGWSPERLAEWRARSYSPIR
ncbi:MAG: TIGR04283 family arsenosugar biosynthesis glycosyltransferase [Coriobacteriia bacterium]|nr:TIGR04283 family arsenosugar biosynthesis glycosyltransferase [Coriobacteriia bacterium]